MKKNFFERKIGTIRIITPKTTLFKKIQEAFLLIKRTDRRQYKSLFSCLKAVFITYKPGYTNEFFMPEGIWFVNHSLIGKSDAKWIASLLIHEAFHATQFRKGKYIASLGKLEKPALEVQQRFLRKVGDIKGEKDIRVAGRQKYWKKMAADQKSFRYFRNLLGALEGKQLRLKRF